MVRHNSCRGKEGDTSISQWPTRRIQPGELSTVARKVEDCGCHQASIEEALKRGDTAARILQTATAGFRSDAVALLRETDQGEEVLDMDRLAGDEEMSPIIKLVDTVVLNALERRASDIHIETRDSDVQVKYRIDGALYRAADPIDIAHHQTIVQRIKVMSELDIAERRVPQDGRFRMRIRGRKIDFRVSIMPAIHGENVVIRILDKEQINEEFRDLNLDVVGFAPQDLKKFRKFIAEPYGMVLVTGPTGSGKRLICTLRSTRSNEEDKIITIEDPSSISFRNYPNSGQREE
jgi:type IV pilus assembly protein PilB